MGLFGSQCVLSGVSLRAARLVLLRRSDARGEGDARADASAGDLRRYVPCAPPVSGGYDGYGRIELYPPRATETDGLIADAIGLAFDDARVRSRLVAAWGDLPADFAALVDGGTHDLDPDLRLTFDGERLVYALVEPSIADAAADTVEASPDPTFAPYKRVALRGLALGALMALASGEDASSEPAASIADVLAGDDGPELREVLARFVQLSAWVRRYGAWGPPKAPVRTDRGAQYTWAEERAMFDAAEARLAAHPPMRRAVAALRAAFIADREADLRDLRDLASISGAVPIAETKRPVDASPIATANDLVTAIAAMNASRSLEPGDCGSYLAKRSPIGCTARGVCATCWGAHVGSDVYADGLALLHYATSSLSDAVVVELASLLDGEVVLEGASATEIVGDREGTIRIEGGLSEESRAFLRDMDPSDWRADVTRSIVIEHPSWLPARYLVPNGRALAVVEGQTVTLAEVLCPGRPNVHAHLMIYGPLGTMDRLVGEIVRLLGPGGAGLERRSLELLLRPLFEHVRIQEAGGDFEVGQRVSTRAFEAAIDRLSAEGGVKMPVAALVFTGVSRLRG